MAWPNNDKKTKEEFLKETFPGKTEQEIKDMLTSFDSVKAKADKVDVLEGNLVNTTSEITQLKTKLQELENRPPVKKEEENKPEKPSWMEDADAAFNDRVSPVVGLTLETRAEMIYDRVVNNLRSEDPLFPKLRKEFDDLVKTGKVGERANQAWVENCYNVVFARKRHEIMRDVKAGNGEYFVETGRGQGGGGQEQKPDPLTTMTDEEKREAAKFGLTPEKWLATKKSIKFYGGQPINM